MYRFILACERVIASFFADRKIIQCIQKFVEYNELQSLLFHVLSHLIE